MSAAAIATARRRTTSYDVAHEAGVAQSTVSRCFRDDSTISPATRARVLEAAERLGYVPNKLARSLITRRSGLIGVVITRTTLRSNPDVIYAIGESLGQAGKQLLLITVEGDWPSLAALRGALEYPLDGLISCVLIGDPDFKALQSRHLPVVFYNRQPERIVSDVVCGNQFEAAGEVATLLHAAGHRRFLCIGGPPEAPVSRLRTQGFVTRLNWLGAKGTTVLETDYSYASGRAAFLAYANDHERPDAVFCANDQIAMGVLDAARTDLGWRIPDDLSVVGFDDIAEAARPGYVLTTVHQESVAMAQQAVELLLLRLANPDSPPVSTMLASVLVRRGSARLSKP